MRLKFGRHSVITFTFLAAFCTLLIYFIVFGLNFATTFDQHFKLFNLLQSQEATSNFHAYNLPSLNISDADIVDSDCIIPVLVIAGDRPMVSVVLSQLISFSPNTSRFPIFVSQDSSHLATKQAIQQFSDVTYMQHPRPFEQENASSEIDPDVGYQFIAHHFKTAIDEVLITLNYSSVIIVEDDLIISADFYEYFSSLLPLMKADPSIWCVSAWNDNGLVDTVEDNPNLLYRTDFFPGLGWMLTRDVWMQMRSHWPGNYWDYGVRIMMIMKKKVCIRPEVSRTFTIGSFGVSKGSLYQDFLSKMKLNVKPGLFSKSSLRQLLKDSPDDVAFLDTVRAYRNVSVQDMIHIKMNPDAAALALQESATYVILYNNWAEFGDSAQQLGLIGEIFSDVPRGSYKGVVTIFLNGVRVFIAPAVDGITTGEDLSDTYRHLLTNVP